MILYAKLFAPFLEPYLRRRLFPRRRLDLDEGYPARRDKRDQVGHSGLEAHRYHLALSYLITAGGLVRHRKNKNASFLESPDDLGLDF